MPILISYLIIYCTIRAKFTLSQLYTKNMATITINKIKQYIRNRLFASIDINDPKIVDLLIEMTQSLQPSQQNLKSIKNLLGGFGILIMPWMKNVYETMCAQFKEQYAKQLKILAAIAKKLCNGQLLPQLSYFTLKGVALKEPTVTIKENQIVFIQRIKYISVFYAKPSSTASENQEFKRQLTKFKSEYSKDYFAHISLRKFEEISRKINNKQSIPNKLVINDFQDYSEEEDDFSQESDDSSNQEQLVLKKKEDVLCSSQIKENRSGSFGQHQRPEKVYDFPQNTELQESNSFKNFSLQSSEHSNNDITSLDSTKQSYNTQSMTISEIISSQYSNKAMKQKSMCCRRYFFDQEILTQTDDTAISMVNYDYPYKISETIELKKIFCSFLNCEGGILYIGVTKDAAGRRRITGGQYSQSKKENVLRAFRQIAQTLEPDIITHKMYNVVFVPIRSEHHPYPFLPGRFVIKCDIRYGIRDEIYSYNDGLGDRFVFRNQGQIFIKEGRTLLTSFRERIMSPLPIPKAAHKGPCEKPEIGQQTHDYIPQMHYKQGYNNENREIGRGRIESKHIAAKEIQARQMKQSSFLKKQNAFYSHQYPTTKKQELCYFFVVGINEKQLVPILQKKNLHMFVKIESNNPDSKKFFIRVTEDSYIQKIKKILKKLAQKYQNIITYHQMSLELKVEQIQTVYRTLQKKIQKFEVRKPNILKYKYYKDALEGFLLLQEARIAVQFWNP